MQFRRLRATRSLSALVCGVGIVVVAALPLPSSANVLPESAFMIHVQPVTGSCATAITNCEQIVGHSDQLGQLEFLLFFLPIYWQQNHDPVNIYAAHLELNWPESWVLLETEACSGWAHLDTSGPPYVLDMAWYDCPDLPIGDHEVFLMARFVFAADVPGVFGYYHWWDGGTVELGCPPASFLSYPNMCFAEVALPCEFTHFHCGYLPPCGIEFADSLMVLSAPPGGSVEGETELWLDLCTLSSLTALAGWLDVSATEIDFGHYRLLVTADATGLPPGTYDSWIRATGDTIGRCMAVEFRVEDLTSTSTTCWSRIKSLYR